MKYLLWSTLVVALMLTTARAQSGDTVCYRLGVGYLADSTGIEYEIGSFGLSHGGSLRYLHFVDTSGNVPANLFKTESFSLGSTDTISFGRFASFFGSGVPKSFSYTDSLDMLDSAGTWYYYHGSDQISPSSTDFASGSSILFIVELRRSSNDAVVQVLDTVKCFLDLAGHLRAQHFPTSYNQRNDIPLGGEINVSHYFTVRVVQSLPSSGTMVRYDYGIITGNNPARTHYDIYTPYETGLPSPKVSTTIRNFSSEETSQDGWIRSISLSPNPTGRSSSLQFSLSESHSVHIQIVAEDGRFMLDQSLLGVQGANAFPILSRNLPSGSYLVALSIGDLRYQTTLKIIH